MTTYTLTVRVGDGREHDIEEYFKVVFREARYFYPLSKKFHLYLLTVLRPVGA